MPQKIPQLLIDELIRREILSPELETQIKEEISTSNEDFDSAVLKRGLLSEDDLLKIKEQTYNLPSVRLIDIEMNRDVSKEISDEIVSFYKIIPIAKEGNTLKVGVVNPEDIDALEALKFIAADKNIQTKLYLMTRKEFESLAGSYKTLGVEVGKALESLSEELSQKELKISQATGGLEEITAEAPVTRIVAVVVKHAVETRASDIHIEPLEDKIRLRFRVDGILQTALFLPRTLLSALVTRIKILTDMKIDETRVPQDGRFSTRFADRTIDFRVSNLPTRHGEKIVMRILDPLVGDIKLIDLGLEGSSLELIRNNLAKPFGEILITGPTGSGKSTTLAAMLREVNHEEVNVITLEDPIEYYIEGVNQSQIHEEIGYTFANGLRHILRQDPDIIMVGEIRDGETASLATQAALTGHIVLSTLHTNDSIGVIPRLIDMGVEKYLIAPTLNLAAAQRLVRRLCQACKMPVEANVGEAKIIKRALERTPAEVKKKFLTEKFTVYKPGEEPCKVCNGKRFKGRIAIFEALEMTDEVEKIVLGQLSEQALRHEAEKQGMVTLFQDGIIKVLKGVTSLEEVFEAAQEFVSRDDQDNS